jgi:hypothetical protein
LPSSPAVSTAAAQEDPTTTSSVKNAVQLFRHPLFTSLVAVGLKTQMRQDCTRNKAFVEALSTLRVGGIPRILFPDYFQSKVGGNARHDSCSHAPNKPTKEVDPFDLVEPIRLFPRKMEADTFNNMAMLAMDEQPMVYRFRIEHRLKKGAAKALKKEDVRVSGGSKETREADAKSKEATTTTSR